jgi:hypothetical protein
MQQTKKTKKQKKHGVVDHRFQGTGWGFAAAVVESLGAFSIEAELIIGKVIRTAAKRQLDPVATYIGRAWARLSCVLIRGTAQMILDRIPQSNEQT